MSKIKWTNEKRKLSELVPWPRNPRQINEEQAKKLSESLTAFDQVETIAIGPENEIYNGHQRLNVWAGEHGPDFEVDVRVSSRKLSEKEREKLTIYLHKGAAGEWDFDTLANEFEVLDLLDWGFDEKELQVAGFDFGEPEEAPEAQIDKAAELQEKWQVERGQIWEIGRHRLMCGDSTSEDDVGRLMGGEIELCFTSPPYADQRTYESNNDLSPKLLSRFISVSVSSVELYVINLGIKRDNDEIIEYWRDYIDSARECGLKMLAWNVWSRHGYGGSVGNLTAMFPVEHEWIFVFGRKSKDINRTVENKHGGKIVSATVRNSQGDMSEPHKAEVRSSGKLGSIFVSDVARGKKDHPAVFPVEFPAEYIKACTSFDGTVYDPFLGSGTTMVAAEQLNRICYGMEIEPKYCAVTLERMSEMGLTPKLVNNG